MRRLDSGLVGSLLISSVIVCAALLVAPPVEANAALRLYPDVADGGGGQLVSHSPFKLNIVNDGHGNGDNTAYGVQLVVAVADPTLLDYVTLSDQDDVVLATYVGSDLGVGTPEFLCDGRPMPPHGVYPAAFTTFDLGDIEAGMTVTLTVDYAGQEGLMVHFDAFGEGIKNNGGCKDIYNPFGHDVTAILEGGGGPPPSDCEVEVDKTSDVDAVVLDDEAVFTITADNLSDCELTVVSITDYLPIVVDDGGVDFPAFTVLNTSPEANLITPTEVVWDLGTLGAWASAIVTMTVVFDEPLADGHRIVNAACFDAEELDEAECDSTTIAVGEVVDPEPIGGPGFWCRQIRAALDGDHNAQFTEEELQEWLDAINEASTVFPEHGSTDTLEAVRQLLCRPNTLRTAEERLLRHLMTLWFNLVSERVEDSTTLAQLCQGDEPLPDGAEPEWTVGYVLEQAELAVTDAADDATLLFWKDVIDFINNSGPPGSCQTFRSGGRVRRYQP